LAAKLISHHNETETLLELGKRKMNRIGLPALFAGMLVLALSACAMMGLRRQDLADNLKTALTGEPVVVEVQNNAVVLTSSADYMFPSGGYQLAPGAPVLSKIVPILAKLQHTNIVVRGFTDNTPVGPALRQTGIASNMDLSSKRADAAVTFLRSQGVNSTLLSAQGFGDNNPVASNDTEAGRAKNRRIEIFLIGDGT
jgi:chemotaxis protein MotB